MTSDSNSDLSISYSSDLLKSNGMNRLIFLLKKKNSIFI